MRRSFLFSAVVLSLSGPIVAQDEVVVKKRGEGKRQIDLSDFGKGKAKSCDLFVATLGGDLERSGWLTVTRGGTGAIRLLGSCVESGGSLRVGCDLVNRTTGKPYFNRKYSESVTGARRMAHKVADDIVFAVMGKKGIASTRIAMIRAVNGKKDLYYCDADGGSLAQVTRQGAICLDPSWRPDGKSILYTSFHNGYPDVYDIDLVSGRRKRISGFSGLNSGAEVSPDGKSIVLTLSKDGNPDLYVMNSRDRRLTRITETKRAVEASPSWSPDGKEIVFVSDRSGRPHLYIAGRSGGRARRLTFRGSQNVSPNWGPDGRVVYSSRREGRYQLCVVNPSGGAAPIQLTRDYVDHEDPSWAPDARHIVYSRTLNYSAAVYVLDTRGDPEVRLTKPGGDWYSPSWSD